MLLTSRSPAAQWDSVRAFLSGSGAAHFDAFRVGCFFEE
jgi:hypothetical protein